MIRIVLFSLPMIVCAIMAFLLALNLFYRWNKPQFRLLLFMITAMLLYTGHFIFFTNSREAIPFSDTIYCFCNPAVYPLFYIYLEELTLRHPKRFWQFLYLLPAIICFIVVGTLYFFMTQEEIAQFIELHLFHNEYSTLTGLAWWQGQAHLLIKIIHALEIPPVLYFGWKHISRYNNLIENIYSDTEDKTASPMKSFLILFALTSLTSFLCNAIGRYQFASSTWLATIPLVIFSILILLIGHAGLRQQFSVNDIENDDILQEPVFHDNKSDLKERLVKLIDDEQYFLKPNLKINILAQQLNTNRNYIYNVINVEMGVSFSELVNHKRIDYAVQLIEKDPNRQLSEIAINSGFSSISAFYRNFKLYKNCSPSVYQQRILNTKGRKV